MRKTQVALGAGLAALGALSVFAVTTAQAAPASPEPSPSVSEVQQHTPAKESLVFSVMEYTLTDSKIVSRRWKVGNGGDNPFQNTVRTFTYDSKTPFCFSEDGDNRKCEPATSEWSRDLLKQAARIYLTVDKEAAHTDLITVGAS